MLWQRSKNIFLIISLFFLLFNSSIAIAMGQYEDVYEKANQLYMDKEYNKAIEILSTMLKEDSEQLDKAQKLLSKIRIAQENYNLIYASLIEAYKKNDMEAVAPLITKLEELDPHPNEANKTFMDIAKKTAEVVIYRNRFLEIMEKAKILIDEEKYTEAVETYVSGFDLGLDNFTVTNYGNVVVNEVLERTERVGELSNEFISIYPQKKESYSAIIDAIDNKDLESIYASAASLVETFSYANEKREELKNIAEYFLTKEGALRNATKTEEQIFHLVFMNLFLEGRPNVGYDEGIVAIIDMVWNKHYKELESKFFELSSDLFNTAYDDYQKNKLEMAKTGFDKSKSFANTVINYIDLGLSTFVNTTNPKRKNILQINKAALEADSVYAQQLFAASIEFPIIIEKWKIVKEIKDEYTFVKKENDKNSKALIGVKDRILSEIPDVEKSLSLWQTKIKEINKQENNKTLENMKLIETEYQNIYDELVSMVIDITVQRAGEELEEMGKEYNELKKVVEDSIDEIKETNNKEELSESEIIKIPAEVATKISEAKTRLAELTNTIGQLDKGLLTEIKPNENTESTDAIKEELKKLSENTNNLLGETVKYEEIAENNELNAEKLRQEGDKRVQEAKELTRQGRYAATRIKLEQAAEKYDEALLYEDDPELLVKRDDEIKQMYNEIRTSENILVVKSVREDIEKAKKAYTEGNFSAAENFLIKAQTRWKDTNVEENTEIAYWLNLARTALTVTTGRVIALTDPLYAEMNQYLNQAYKDLQTAKEKIEKGNKAEADVYFDKAEKSILHVKKFFPLNEEASVLKLKISRYRDPERFKEIFGNEFNTAKSLITSDPQKAYIQLKDLEAIDKDFPGLQAVILEAEYATGIKVRPPDPEKLKRSIELYDLAYEIVSGNVRSEFPVALSYLEEAISLNPENDEALRLKDRISTDVGGTSENIMSNSDQMLYDEAVSEFTAGNYLKAKIIIQKLLQNVENQKNTKILDLQERIERAR